MSLSPAQLEARRSRIGASDVAAIADLYSGQQRTDPFKTAASVYASKVLGVDSEAGASATIGNKLEPMILDEAEAALAMKLQRNVEAPHADGLVVATLDGLGNDVLPVEVKAVSIIRKSPLEGMWGEDGTDEIPPCYMWQVQAQMACTGSEIAEVFALIARRGLCHFSVRRSERLIDTLLGWCERFWVEHVEAQRPPEGEPAPLQMLRRVERQHDLIVPVDDDVVKAAIEARKVASAAKRASELADAALLQQLGLASAGRSGLGLVEVTKSKRTYAPSAEKVIEVTSIKLPKHKELPDESSAGIEY